MAFMPFLSDKEWLDEFENIKDKKADILFTHMAFDGSCNNDGSKVDSKLTPTVLKSINSS